MAEFLIEITSIEAGGGWSMKSIKLIKSTARVGRGEDSIEVVELMANGAGCLITGAWSIKAIKLMQCSIKGEWVSKAIKLIVSLGVGK